jgi:two-component system, OmpR family, phosphate regulon response regulator PhoB
MKTILIIEDEKDLAELVAWNLEKEGYRAVTAHDGPAGIEAAGREAPDLILLDLMLPGIMGTEVCRILKKQERTAATPVMMLTAKGEEVDRIVGFELGADDYIVKPFSVRELLLRVKAVLRRHEGATAPGKQSIVNGPLAVDPETCTATVGGVEVPLTTLEFKLLLNLAERLGRVQSRDLLLKNVWGYSYVGDTRTVDTHMTRLRTKLGHAGNLIRTVRGFGYRMDPYEE